MSRVGRQPIPVPPGVTVKLEGRRVTVKGPQGELSHEVPERISVVQEDGKLLVRREDDERTTRALHGLTRSLLANMVTGVTAGFSKTLELVGTGYRASKQGNKLVLAVGFSHPVELDPPAGITIDVPAPNTIVVKGADKQAVGQVAARIREVRPPEPYLGKGIRYQGERIRRKVGKTGK
ncbi:MAG: 50S ribosomal protein L6 [Clostridia bacterium]|nr:50S ribosomal protein L6 [Clostridia bacterium]